VSAVVTTTSESIRDDTASSCSLPHRIYAAQLAPARIRPLGAAALRLCVAMGPAAAGRRKRGRATTMTGAVGSRQVG
jgi:hypothetical protein